MSDKPHWQYVADRHEALYHVSKKEFIYRMKQYGWTDPEIRLMERYLDKKEVSQ